MIYCSLVLLAIAAISLIITLPFRDGVQAEFWKWWDSIGVGIFMFDCAVLFVIAVWCGWLPSF